MLLYTYHTEPAGWPAHESVGDLSMHLAAEFPATIGV